MAKKKRIDRSKSESSSLNPLAAALLEKGLKPSQTCKEMPESPLKGAPVLDPSRWTTQIEKKGHGGKTVTLVRGMRDPQDVADFLKKKLGSGAKVRDGAVIIQGDLRERIAALKSL